jgi:hypothetical protein
MSQLKSLVNKRITKKVNFMGEKVEISKLTVSEVKSIQEDSKALMEDTDNEDAGFAFIKNIICKSVEGAEDLTDEDFDNLPMDELAKLSKDIMAFSGMAGDEKGK